MVLLKKRALVDVIKLKGGQRQSWSPVNDVFLNRGHLGKKRDMLRGGNLVKEKMGRVHSIRTSERIGTERTLLPKEQKTQMDDSGSRVLEAVRPQILNFL